MRDESLEIHRTWSSKFLTEALSAKLDQDAVRLALASVQSAVAIFEIAREHAKYKEEIKDLGKRLLPHLSLLRDLRAQIFHRRIVPGLFKSESRSNFFWSGPIKIGTGTSEKGTASVFMNASGPQAFLDGGTIKRNIGGSARDLAACDGRIFDQEMNQWVTLTDALGSYLNGVPAFLKACQPFLSEGPERA